VAVARLMELTNALRKALDSPAPAAGSLRDGAEVLAVMLGCWAPYTAEEAWSRLGHDVEAGDSVHDTTWPTADPALLVQETVTCVVQVAGKVRARLQVPPDVSEDDLRAEALAAEGVVAALAGRDVRTVVVRAPKLVNIVPA
jgi:leucyl-tRNA synthetase